MHVSGDTATVTIDGGSVFNNLAASEGGGLWNQAGSTLVVQNGTLIDSNEAFGNDATNGGGGIFNNGGVVNVTGSCNYDQQQFCLRHSRVGRRNLQWQSSWPRRHSVWVAVGQRCNHQRQCGQSRLAAVSKLKQAQRPI
ncbi:MAG: hypothetical protein R3C53_21165 [Pirellulaceae bacterium]